MISSSLAVPIDQGDEVMSEIKRPPALVMVLVVSAVCLVLVPIAISLLGPRLAAASFRPTQDYGGQDPGGADMPILDPLGQDPGLDDAAPRRGSRSRAVRKRLRSPDKGATKKTDAAAKKKPAPARTDSGNGAALKFSQDIAPILVANCTGCHSGTGRGLRQGKLDLSTFEKLQKRTPKIIFPGRPDESKIVLRIKGEETPQMPLGGNRTLSDEAIAKIEQWIKQGAKLDTGVTSGATLESYAASPEQVRRAQVAKQPIAERDKSIEDAGRQRWKIAGAPGKPDVVTGEHFIIFSSLARERASSLLRPMEAQYSQLKRLLGAASMDWVEKVSLIVFSSRKELIEFVRTVDKREVESYEAAIAHLDVPQPYVAAVDPLGGKKEDPASRHRVRPKREEDNEAPAADRTLPGLLTEALGSGAVSAAGKAPRWLSKGIGSYLASHLEPRSSFYRHLRQSALANFEQGWLTRATEALGDDVEKLPAGDLHAIGFALVEAMMSGELKQRFPAFVGGMMNGKEKLDDVLTKVYGGTREDFLTDTGNWVAQTYGNNQ
jgi:hypothetical protein